MMGRDRQAKGISGEQEQAFPSGGPPAGVPMNGEMRVSESEEPGKSV